MDSRVTMGPDPLVEPNGETSVTINTGLVNMRFAE